MELNITINTDNGFIQHTMSMLCSLYENNKRHEIVVHVLQNNLSEESRKYLKDLTSRYDKKIVFYSVNESVLNGVQFRKNRPLSLAAYYRLLLSETLPQSLDKVLYLDCDTIVVQDISEIFQLEINDYALAATLDSFPYSNQHRNQLHMEADERTFCSGVMLVNLEYWRENNVTAGLLEYAKRHRREVYLHDQDVLNYYFKKKWFLLPPKWNRYATSSKAFRCCDYRFFDYREYTLSPIIYHYASVNIKPWYKGLSPRKGYYVKYLELSGYDKITYTPITLKHKIKFAYLSFRTQIAEIVREKLNIF